MKQAGGIEFDPGDGPAQRDRHAGHQPHPEEQHGGGHHRRLRRTDQRVLERPRQPDVLPHRVVVLPRHRQLQERRRRQGRHGHPPHRLQTIRPAGPALGHPPRPRPHVEHRQILHPPQ